MFQAAPQRTIHVNELVFEKFILNGASGDIDHKLKPTRPENAPAKQPVDNGDKLHRD